MKKKYFFRFLKNKYFIIVVVVVVIGAIYYYSTHKSSAPTFESSTASIGTVVQQVSVTGTISPINKADLSFEKSGVISNIYVKVGDTVKAGNTIASLDNAIDRAALASAQASFDEVSRGLRPQEYAADQAAVSAASTTLANAQKDALNAVRDSYTQAQSALVNYSDSFFDNPQTVNPIINIPVQSTNFQNNINSERSFVSSELYKWSNDAVVMMSTSDATKLIANAEGYITVIKNFLNDLAGAVNYLSPNVSGLTQTVINSDVSKMNSAISTFNQAINTVSTADTKLKNALSAYAQAESNFTLQQAGSSPQTIAAQAAKVSQAQAVLAQDSITSPIDGIVTKADPSIGEFTVAGQSGFTIQNSGFKIEAYVPEADIAKVVISDLASSTLDAYGSYVDFPAKVIMIDPAETVLEGVPTYKVTLQFVTSDPRIRSGMTANLEILTNEADNVLTVPYRAIVLTATSTSVRLISKDGKNFKIAPVVAGLKGSDGNIEIVSGLKAGDKVVTYIQQ